MIFYFKGYERVKVFFKVFYISEVRLIILLMYNLLFKFEYFFVFFYFSMFVIFMIFNLFIIFFWILYGEDLIGIIFGYCFFSFLKLLWFLVCKLISYWICIYSIILDLVKKIIKVRYCFLYLRILFFNLEYKNSIGEIEIEVWLRV